jgi:uncharacterized protein
MRCPNAITHVLRCNRRNLSKHKISFETAQSVFDDPHQVSVQDRVVGREERWQTLGMVSGVVVIVAHTWEEEDSRQVMRLISARKATAREWGICGTIAVKLARFALLSRCETARSTPRIFHSRPIGARPLSAASTVQSRSQSRLARINSILRRVMEQAAPKRRRS